MIKFIRKDNSNASKEISECQDYLIKNSWLNTMMHRSKELGNIKIYNENGVVVDLNERWLTKGGSNNLYQYIGFDYALVNKRKLDFTYGKSFLFKETYEHLYGGNHITLYIHESELPTLEFKEERHQNDDYTTTIMKYVECEYFKVYYGGDRVAPSNQYELLANDIKNWLDSHVGSEDDIEKLKKMQQIIKYGRSW